jgi:hypothetical protein
MKLPLALALATSILSRLVPPGDREPLVGDLAEEYALRVRADPSYAPHLWYLRQIWSSIPPIIRMRLSREAWCATLGVALVAYFAVGLGQLAVAWAIPTSSEPTYDPLGLIVTFPLIVIIGYFAERSRRGAAAVLATLMLLAITAITLLIAVTAPVWYQAAYFFVGPVGAIVGGALHESHASSRAANSRAAQPSNARTRGDN